MNAPFQTRAGLRDPFTAFVCDDATADMLRPVAVEHGWSPEKVNKGGLRNAVQSLSVSASPNILFVDLSESADPLNDINALALPIGLNHAVTFKCADLAVMAITARSITYKAAWLKDQGRPALSRSRRQRHSRLSSEAVHGRSAARHVRACADDPVGAAR